MNSNTGLSIFSKDIIINKILSKEDENALLNIYEDIKKYINSKEHTPLNILYFKKIIKQLSEKIKNNKINVDIKNLLIKAKKEISLIISPVRKFNRKNSEFINALKEGYWVLIDGIDLAPKELIEKIVDLNGDNP